MKTLPSICLSALLLAAPSALANGGGYYDYGGKYQNLIPFEMEEIDAIAMETEDLRVEVGPKESVIHVRYTMRNTKDKKVQCRFGFPADICGVSSEDLNILATQTDLYEVKVDGKPIPFKCMKQPVQEYDEYGRRLIHAPGSEIRHYWMVSELKVAANESFVLEIRFRVPNLRQDLRQEGSGGTSTEFLYRFSSAAVWNGPIRKGHVEFVPKGLDPQFFKPLKPANRFTRRESDGAWVWDFTDLEPTLDDDVTFRVLPEQGEEQSTVVHHDDERGVWIWSENWVVRYGDNWARGIDIDEWTMTASHTSARKIEHYYREEKIEAPLDVAQLPKRRRYDHHDDVWGTDAPDNGVGQSVTMTFKKPVKLGALKLSNEWMGHYGYGKVTRIKVVINGKWSKEFDLDGETLLPLFGSPSAKTVQLVIVKATPGTKHPETILSNLQAFRALPKKPRIDESR